MRLLVCGGREFTDISKLWERLDKMRPTEILHGNAKGADQLAGQYARSRGLKEVAVNARKPVGNTYMILNHAPDRVLACPGDKGTHNMKQQARARGIPVETL